MGEASHQSGLHGIGHPRDDDGNRRGGPFRGEGRLGVDRDDHVDLDAHQLLREVAERLVAGAGESPFDRNVAPVLVAEVAKPLSEGLERSWPSRPPGKPPAPKTPTALLSCNPN